MEYHFDEYHVSTDQQILVKGKETIPLGTKVYYLLLVLVENAGQVLSKDQIIDVVWPGQIVTDTALVKQILRLRKILDDQQREIPFIETHRGVGYRFTVAIDVIENNTGSVATVGRNRINKRAMGMILALVVLLFWYFAQSWFGPDPGPTPQLEGEQVITLAFLPSTNKQDWLNRGGLDYLADLLGEHELINTINPQPEWYTAESPEELAIELTTHKNIHYSCLIDIRETARGYSLEARLRTDTEVISTSTFEDETLRGVFNQTDQWINTHLSVRDHLSTQPPQLPLTLDRYALESYLQGIYELEVTNDKRKAMDYFQAAVNKDPEFLAAWIKLGGTKVDVADYEKAISISKTLLARKDVQTQPKMLLQLRYLTAQVYARLLDHELAAEYANLAVETLDSVEDPYLRINVLRSLTLLAQVQKEWEKAETYMLQCLAVANEHYPLPNALAEFHSSLANIYQQQRKLEKMKIQAEIALSLYEETNNVNGMMWSFARLSRYYLVTGRFDEGLLITSRAEPYLDQSTRPDAVVKYLESAASMANLRGMFNKSQDYIVRAQLLAQQTGNNIYLYNAEFLKLHRLYVQNRFEQSMNQIGTMIADLGDDTHYKIIEIFVMQVAVLVSSRFEPPAETERRLQELVQKYPDRIKQFSIELMRPQGHLAINQGRVKEGLELLRQSEQGERDRNDTHVANYIGYEILEVLLEHPELEYRDTMTRLEGNTDYDYPFFKLKAQFMAREGRFLEAVMLMRENKLRANQLWKAEDQLLLEQFQQQSG